VPSPKLVPLLLTDGERDALESLARKRTAVGAIIGTHRTAAGSRPPRMYDLHAVALTLDTQVIVFSVHTMTVTMFTWEGRWILGQGSARTGL
jgi:hypothetical protein